MKTRKKCAAELGSTSKHQIIRAKTKRRGGGGRGGAVLRGQGDKAQKS